MARIDQLFPFDTSPKPAAQTPQGSEPAATAQPAGAAMVVAHYLELLRANLRLVVALSLLAALLAGGLAAYKLQSAPVYRASAKVTVQPTDAELRFTQVYVRSSSYDSANVVTQSHMEYLQSREIAARAHEILSARYAAAPAAPPAAPEAGLLATLKGLKAKAKQTLRWLDSGRFVQVTGPEAEISEIQDAIEINMIESSFIMEIAVRWDDPQTATDIANILAEVYQQRTQEQTADATVKLTRFLQAQAADTQARIDALTAERASLRAEHGIADLQAQRSALLSRLATERERLDADTAALRGAAAVIAAFEAQDDGRRRGGLDETAETELTLARLRQVELTESLAERRGVIAGLEAQSATLTALEKPFAEIDQALLQERDRLSDIRSRQLSVELNQAESLETLRLIDPARPPVYPEEPRVVVSTVMGGSAGLLIALMLIFARDVTSQSLRTRAELSELPGVTALGDVRLGARSSGDPERPYLGWHGFDTDSEVCVFDTSSEDRARAAGLLVLDHYPYSDRVSSGLLQQARKRGYMPRATAAVLITTGRGESTAAELASAIAALRKNAPQAEIAVAYVTGRPPKES